MKSVWKHTQMMAEALAEGMGRKRNLCKNLQNAQ